MDLAFFIWHRRRAGSPILSGQIQVNRTQVLLIASRNKGKVRELRELLVDLPFVLRSLSELSLTQTIPETGETFVENASLKATGYARQARVLTLADDSGLAVDALGGAPGVLSARYAGERASDAERTAKLLSELAAVAKEERSARFVAAIAIADEFGRIIHVCAGVCDGRIAEKPKGSRGFGYDPIFIPNGFEETFGELPASIKNQISHRARALAQARNFLRSLTSDSTAG
jgi:XTP/dITP diphosphohydrolase